MGGIMRFMAWGVCLGVLSLGLAACGGGGGSGNTTTPAAAPTVGATVPAAGFQVGGTAVTITGTGFSTGGANTVVIGGAPATSVVTVNDTTITCITGASAASGPAAVVVNNTNGAGSNATGFTYVAFPPTPDPTGDAQVDEELATRVGEAPVIACSGGIIHVAWIEDRGPGARVYYSRSTDGGASWSATDTLINDAGATTLFGLRICADGNNVYLAWVDQRDGAPRVYMNSSSNAGVTWRATDVQVSQTAASNDQGYFHDICCSGSTLAVVWPVGANMFAQRTTDGGTTWLAADVQVDDAGSAVNIVFIRLCCTASTVHLVWSDNRNGSADVYYDRSIDGGATWGTDARIDSGAGAFGAFSPNICCEGSLVHVAWVDNRDGSNDIYANSSSNGGLAWGASDKRVSRFPVGTANVFAHGICCEGSSVHITWLDARSGLSEPFVNSSTDGGATYGATDTRLNTGVAAGTFSVTNTLTDNEQPNSQICCDQGVVHVCWADNRAGAATTNVFMNSSADGGATWLAADVRLDTDLPNPGTTLGGNPKMCCDGPLAYTVWRDERNNVGSGEGDIAFQRTVP